MMGGVSGRVSPSIFKALSSIASIEQTKPSPQTLGCSVVMKLFSSTFPNVLSHEALVL